MKPVILYVNPADDTCFKPIVRLSEYVMVVVNYHTGERQQMLTHDLFNVYRPMPERVEAA